MDQFGGAVKDALSVLCTGCAAEGFIKEFF